MKVYAGIDLGSTTTKAVIMTEDGQLLGRGITNSRNNYDVACAVARAEALTTARFELLRRAITAARALSDPAGSLLRLLERRFRREQHERQLESLRETCLLMITSPDDQAPVEEIFAGMREESITLFAPEGTARAASDFFRDIAASQYHRLAEDVARHGQGRFDRLMGCFDKSIFRAENSPPDLSFESNIRAALGKCVAEKAISGDGTVEELSTMVETAARTPFLECAATGTGYGRVRLPFPKESIRSEILCHGLGAHYFYPATATVLDIGGQDTKAIQVDEQGIVTSFQMNDRCAAGCGRYLGYIADEMNLAVQELGPLALQSCRPTRIASTCTVFAGAELRERLSLGQKREDILAGLHRAIILRSMSLLARSGGVHEQFTFTGGVARNPAALQAVRLLIEENYGQRTINISPDSIYTGAVGAALFAKRGSREDTAGRAHAATAH